LPRAIEQDYKLTETVLGSGYNGQVHMAKSIRTGEKVAVKGFKMHGISKETKVDLQSECEIFLSMDHPHVARLVDVYEGEDQLNLVMECLNGGELFARVKARKRFSERDAAHAANQMLLAVNYIHSHGVVHRDLKLENFLYESAESDHLKLIDFGFSKVWDTNTKMAVSCGTLAYVAPEVLDASYTSQCDMWSLGVTIFILLFGYMPFFGTDESQARAIRDGKYRKKPEIWAKVSKTAQDFVTKLLVVDPSARMTAEQALNHTWITGRKQMEDSQLNQDIVDALQSFGQASAFRKACMSMMAWSLTNDERARVRQAFLEMDTERTGTITISEFKQVLEAKFHMTDEKHVEIFKALDQTHDDEIHYSEFLAAMVSSRIALHDDLLWKTFKRFDTDNSGTITLANLQQVLGSNFDGATVQELLHEADFTGDNQISYQEFISYLKGDKADNRHAEAAAHIIDREIDRDSGVKMQQIRIKSEYSSATPQPKRSAKGNPLQRCNCAVL